MDTLVHKPEKRLLRKLTFWKRPKPAAVFNVWQFMSAPQPWLAHSEQHFAKSAQSLPVFVSSNRALDKFFARRKYDIDYDSDDDYNPILVHRMHHCCNYANNMDATSLDDMATHFNSTIVESVLDDGSKIQTLDLYFCTSAGAAKIWLATLVQKTISKTECILLLKSVLDHHVGSFSVTTMINSIAQKLGRIYKKLAQYDAQYHIQQQKLRSDVCWQLVLFVDSKCKAGIQWSDDLSLEASVSDQHAPNMLMSHLAQMDQVLWQSFKAPVDRFDIVTRLVHGPEAKKFASQGILRHNTSIRLQNYDQLVIVVAHPPADGCILFDTLNCLYTIVHQDACSVWTFNGHLYAKVAVQKSCPDKHLLLLRYPSNPKLECTVIDPLNFANLQLMADFWLKNPSRTLQRHLLCRRHTDNPFAIGQTITCVSERTVLINKIKNVQSLKLAVSKALHLPDFVPAPSFKSKTNNGMVRMLWCTQNHIVLLCVTLSGILIMCVFVFKALPAGSSSNYSNRELGSFCFGMRDFSKPSESVVVSCYEFFDGHVLDIASLIVSHDTFLDQSSTLPVITQFVLEKRMDDDTVEEEHYCMTLVPAGQESPANVMSIKSCSINLNISRATRNAGLRLWLGNVTKKSVAHGKTDLDTSANFSKNQNLLTAAAANPKNLLETGFFAYKACVTEDNKPCIVTLFVPPTALVSNWTGRDPKKRFSDVLVLAIDRVPILADGTLDGTYKPGKPQILSLVETALNSNNKALVDGVEFGILCLVCGKTPKDTLPSDIGWVRCEPCGHVCCMNCHSLGTKSLKKSQTVPKCLACYKPYTSCKYLEQRELLPTDFFVDWQPPTNKEVLQCARSIHNPKFYYNVGQSIHIANFDTNLSNVCSSGVHAFVADVDGKCFEHVIAYGASNCNMQVSKNPPPAPSAAPVVELADKPKKIKSSMVASSSAASSSNQKTTETSISVVESPAKDLPSKKICAKKSQKKKTSNTVTIVPETSPNMLELANLASSSMPLSLGDPDEEECSFDDSEDEPPALSPSNVAAPSSSDVAIALWNQRDASQRSDSSVTRSIYPTLEEFTNPDHYLPSDAIDIVSAHASGIVSSDDPLDNLVTETFGSVKMLRPLLKIADEDLIQWTPVVPEEVPQKNTTEPVSVSAMTADKTFESQFPTVPDKKVVIESESPPPSYNEHVNKKRILEPAQ